MITEKELEEEGFKHYPGTTEWEKDNLQLMINEGIVTFVRENENYHGLNVWITSIDKLKTLMSLRNP